jgi:hypothetical protein
MLFAVSVVVEVVLIRIFLYRKAACFSVFTAVDWGPGRDHLSDRSDSQASLRTGSAIAEPFETFARLCI